MTDGVAQQFGADGNGVGGHRGGERLADSGELGCELPSADPSALGVMGYDDEGRRVTSRPWSRPVANSHRHASRLPERRPPPMTISPKQPDLGNGAATVTRTQ